jgi:hypothetical protein
MIVNLIFIFRIKKVDAIRANTMRKHSLGVVGYVFLYSVPISFVVPDFFTG